MARVKRSGMGIAALKQELETLSKKKAEVGFFETAHYDDGTPVAYIASIQEFGHGAIPPRSFMRTTVSEQRDAWRETLAQGAKRVLSGKMTAQQMLSTVGQMAAGNIREKIASITSPALKQSTIDARARKGLINDKPLVETSKMIESVDSRVVDK